MAVRTTTDASETSPYSSGPRKRVSTSVPTRPTRARRAWWRRSTWRPGRRDGRGPASSLHGAEVAAEERLARGRLLRTPAQKRSPRGAPAWCRVGRCSTARARQSPDSPARMPSSRGAGARDGLPNAQGIVYPWCGASISESGRNGLARCSAPGRRCAARAFRFASDTRKAVPERRYRRRVLPSATAWDNPANRGSVRRRQHPPPASSVSLPCPGSSSRHLP